MRFSDPQVSIVVNYSNELPQFLPVSRKGNAGLPLLSYIPVGIVLG
jgi:hypothetical protein